MGRYRGKFNKREIALAAKFADAVDSACNESGIDALNRVYGDEQEFRRIVRKVARQLGMKGKVKSGVYRVAFVSDKVVFKIEYSLGQTSLENEANFITKMRRDRTYGRHFPLTMYLTGPDSGLGILLQETVNMSQRGKMTYLTEVERLAEHLGISDCHQYNYGWRGPKNRQYPVFVDVDVYDYSRLKHRKHPSRRSWMV